MEPTAWCGTCYPWIRTSLTGSSLSRSHRDAIARRRGAGVNTDLAVLRAVYFVAAIVLSGEFAFRWCVERPALRGLSGPPAEVPRALHPRWMIQAIAGGTALLATLLWFVVQLEVMSGMPVAAFT